MDATKAAQHQSVYRDVNERIRSLGHSISHAKVVCECAHPECNETIDMSLDEYEAIKCIPHHFLVVAATSIFSRTSSGSSRPTPATGWSRSSASRE